MLNQSSEIIENFQYHYDWGRCLFKNEQQYYSDKNIIKTDGGYDLVVKKEHVTDNTLWWNPKKIEFDYTSGMLFSKDKFLYGSFEIDAYIPSGYGLWSAFWLFGVKKNVNGKHQWFSEIDIFEYYGDKHKYTYNSHAGVDYEHNIYGKSSGIVLRGLEDSWHTYRLDWTPEKLKYYIDDKLVGVRSAKYHNIPLTLIINVAVEKNIGNKLNTYLPTKMMVKNIKYYGIHK